MSTELCCEKCGRIIPDTQECPEHGFSNYCENGATSARRRRAHVVMHLELAQTLLLDGCLLPSAHSSAVKQQVHVALLTMRGAIAISEQRLLPFSG